MRIQPAKEKRQLPVGKKVRWPGCRGTGLVGAPLVNTRYGDDQGGAVEYLGETIGLAVVVTLNE